MQLTTIILIATVACHGAFAMQERKQCRTRHEDKSECGYPGIREGHCYMFGCCYEKYNSANGGNVPWCYKYNSSITVSQKTLLLMAANGVDPEIITALYADTVKGAEWVTAFRDGKLDTARLLSVIYGHGSMKLNPLVAKFLKGENAKYFIIQEIAKQTGYSDILRRPYLSTISLWVNFGQNIVELRTFAVILLAYCCVNTYVLDSAFAGNTEAVIKHALALQAAKNQYIGLPGDVFRAALYGNLNKDVLIHGYVDRLLAGNDVFQKAFYKSLATGNTEDAIQWLYLSATKDINPQGTFYPHNAALFAYLVETHKEHPNKATPGILLAMAKGHELDDMKKMKPFKTLFGIKATQYVCAAHSPNLRTRCEKLSMRSYYTDQECVDAGCCLGKSSYGGNVCYENILGSIGVGLALAAIDQDYVIANVFGGNLPDINTVFSIPWLPATDLSFQYNNFASGASQDIFQQFLPTVAPIKLDATKFRPNFRWTPHGPTVFPFPTQLPGSLLVSTLSPGSLNTLPTVTTDIGDAQHLSVGYSKCSFVGKKDRFKCMDNDKAFAKDGKALCESIGCCYSPVWTDFTIPACFRKRSYGQCYLVADSEKIDCGYEGITQDECMKNSQCCYATPSDPNVIMTNDVNEIPWCYYKKFVPIDISNKCTVPIVISDRKPCLTGWKAHLNELIDEEACKNIGCCYKKEELSIFERLIRAYDPPACYKARKFDPTPTQTSPPPGSGPPSFQCADPDILHPFQRVDCGHYNWFSCQRAGCCWHPVYQVPGAPFCYRKTPV